MKERARRIFKNLSSWQLTGIFLTLLHACIVFSCLLLHIPVLGFEWFVFGLIAGLTYGFFVVRKVRFVLFINGREMVNSLDYVDRDGEHRVELEFRAEQGEKLTVVSEKGLSRHRNN